MRILDKLIDNNDAEYLKCSNVLFKCFDSFSQKSEQIGKIKIDQWAQIQAADGRNTITNLLVWTMLLDLKAVFEFF